MTRSHPNQLIETKTEYDQEEFLNQVVRLALDEAECISNAENVETVAPARPPQHLTLPPAPESPILCSPMTATTMNSTRRASFSLSSVSNSPRPSSFTDSPRPNYLAEGGLPMLHVPLSPMNLNGGNNTGTPTGTSPAVTPRQGTSRAPCRHKMNCHLRSRCKFFHPPEHQMFWQVLERYDPLAKTELCRHQLTNKRGCRMGPESCRFSHSPHDSWCRRCGEVGHVQSECAVPAPAPSSTGDQPKPLKTAICRHWARGECTNVNCTFAHGEADAHCMKCQRTGHVTASCPRHLASRVGLAG